MIDGLVRPIVGIENRTAQEAFDIMADRIRSHFAATPAAPATGGVREGYWIGDFWQRPSCENGAQGLPRCGECSSCLATPPIPEQAPAAHRTEREAVGVSIDDMSPSDRLLRIAEHLESGGLWVSKSCTKYFNGPSWAAYLREAAALTPPTASSPAGSASASELMPQDGVPGRVVLSADDPLAKSLRPKPRQTTTSTADVSNVLIGSASAREEALRTEAILDYVRAWRGCTHWHRGAANDLAAELAPMLAALAQPQDDETKGMG